MGQTRDTVAKEVAQALTNQGIKGINYDWRNTNNDYQELALHDIAQEVAQGDTNPDKNVIEKRLQANNLLSGKVLVVYSTDFTNDDPQKITNTFISQEVFKAIFAAFAGNTSAVEGTKNYYNGNDAYHYEFWLEGKLHCNTCIRSRNWY